MQASVHTFDPETGSGTVIGDDGRVWTFDSEVFAASGLRLLRVGQRLTVEPASGSAADDDSTDDQSHHASSAADQATPQRPLSRIGIRGIGDGAPLR